MWKYTKRISFISWPCILSNIIILENERCKYVRGHSNIMWHVFGTFHTPRVTFFNFWWLIFRPKMLWNIKWIRNKVSLKALSCFLTKSFTFKSIKNCVLKSKKKYVWHFVYPPHIIWKAPYCGKLPRWYNSFFSTLFFYHYHDITVNVYR